MYQVQLVGEALDRNFTKRFSQPDLPKCMLISSKNLNLKPDIGCNAMNVFQIEKCVNDWVRIGLGMLNNENRGNQIVHYHLGNFSFSKLQKIQV